MRWVATIVALVLHGTTSPAQSVATYGAGATASCGTWLDCRLFGWADATLRRLPQKTSARAASGRCPLKRQIVAVPRWACQRVDTRAEAPPAHDTWRRSKPSKRGG